MQWASIRYIQSTEVYNNMYHNNQNKKRGTANGTGYNSNYRSSQFGFANQGNGHSIKDKGFYDCGEGRDRSYAGRDYFANDFRDDMRMIEAERRLNELSFRRGYAAAFNRSFPMQAEECPPTMGSRMPLDDYRTSGPRMPLYTRSSSNNFNRYGEYARYDSPYLVNTSYDNGIQREFGGPPIFAVMDRRVNGDEVSAYCLIKRISQ